MVEGSIGISKSTCDSTESTNKSSEVPSTKLRIKPTQLTPRNKKQAWETPTRELVSFSPPPPDNSSVAKRAENSPYSNPNGCLKKVAVRSISQRSRMLESDSELSLDFSRTKTTLSMISTNGRPRKLSTLNLERLQNAKETAEKAIKAKKVFTIQGPYTHVRESLRQRGWIEKFYKIEPTPKKSPRSKKKRMSNGGASDDSDQADDDDDGDDDDDDDLPKEDENKLKPWEEDDGMYGIMSRMARNTAPQFIWCIRRDAIDFRYLRREQMVNHYGQNGAFTTKVGLCTNLRNAHWFEDISHETFFPRCYRLSHEEEKGSFIDDYYLTACMSVVRWVIMRHRENHCSEIPSDEETEKELHRAPPVNAPLADDNEETTTNQETEENKSTPRIEPVKEQKSPRKERKRKMAPRLPLSFLDTALMQCEQFIKFHEHEELEDITSHEMINNNWESFLQQYYTLCHHGGIIPNTRHKLDECEQMAAKLRRFCPQFDLDGLKNMWIVKPGAKSRGRGITCYDKLNDMLKLVDSVVRKDSKFVVQKYIERPLLIHNTKFDIRQWFLVTDWNPLTIWWYSDFYLRFCKKIFTLDELDDVIHLSNNAIQKNYAVDPARNKEIPADSMWASDDEFTHFLKRRQMGHVLEERIKPGMQKAVICALLTTRDIIEYRKSSFELYGADFMLTEDYTPWLLEINSSPTLSMSTHVTKRLCPEVIEDTMKVVIDRKQDKTCDTGKFELIYKTNQVAVPQYLGINLAVEGNALKVPNAANSNNNPKIRRSEPVYLPMASLKCDLTNSSPLVSIAKKEKKKKIGLRQAKEKEKVSPEMPEIVKKSVEISESRLTNHKSGASSKRTSPNEPAPSSSETNSAKLEKSEPLLVKRKKAKSVELAKQHKSADLTKQQLDLMKPTDSYLRKIREGLKHTEQLKVEPGIDQNLCPKCGSNGIIRFSQENVECSCRKDCIETDYSRDNMIPYQLRSSQALYQNLPEHANSNDARTRVLRALEKESAQSGQVVMPIGPRKLVIKPPDCLPIVASGNFSRYMNVTPGPDTLPYRKPRKPRSNLKYPKFPDSSQTMFVLAESYSNSRP